MSVDPNCPPAPAGLLPFPRSFLDVIHSHTKIAFRITELNSDAIVPIGTPDSLTNAQLTFLVVNLADLVERLSAEVLRQEETIEELTASLSE
jgi:hypothetical protein